ncbi:MULTISPECIES: DUF1868 domain-containing protein [unclassified Rhizobium]|uniref:DUF1868 domain-containing protein n=1 Tax=unclassified Rhizobium TaxID=2613769 RepID=UPI001ADAAC3E|nr:MULTISPECIES: DUF1868 domain-containing protein [unclassified Rhizobium]MBO9100263.1 DUF1868 domain-containing protein [Rhizobium sp. L58/93]MBO9135580.1 DUF1868 domain-containing protein [Rhizobium sp. B209b/85]MBO9170229.1 DUF1868 domain-containing protein [Rhizobium sp. L245/93]MBO9186156.1 DUF1868 domain-containing protein [Rhizobium sp. E27B/91]QXZ83081.1 DUF1868 domain-containing protein [Rhizobium sp. K1/93]
MNAANLSPDLLFYSKSRHPEPSVHLGRRFDLSGTFQYEPGNTIVCHVVDGSETQQALIDARAKYLAMPEAGQFTFTAMSSLHMTLFQGIIEYRRDRQFWPADLPTDMPIDEMTEVMGERLKAFSMRDPFKVSVTRARPSGLLVDGATAEDRRIMRAWRDAFADLLGYRHPDHDTYAFHITFAYVIERLSDEALPRWQQLLDEIGSDVRERCPILELRPPAFCAFDDMNHFEELMVFNFKP